MITNLPGHSENGPNADLLRQLLELAHNEPQHHALVAKVSATIISQHHSLALYDALSTEETKAAVLEQLHDAQERFREGDSSEGNRLRC